MLQIPRRVERQPARASWPSSEVAPLVRNLPFLRCDFSPAHLVSFHEPRPFPHQVVEIMNDRIMRALDGEVSADQLTHEERAELQHYRAAICTALAPVQHLAPIDVESAVMCRVAPEPGPVHH